MFLDFLNNPITAAVIKSAIVIFALLTAFAYMTLIERRVVAKIQGRLGPNRVGPGGMFQPVADAIKMAFKEQIIPSQAKKAIYLVAPIISVIVALSAFAVVPIGNPVTAIRCSGRCAARPRWFLMRRAWDLHSAAR